MSSQNQNQSGKTGCVSQNRYTTIFVGNQIFRIYILPNLDASFNFVVERERSDFSSTVTQISNITEKQCLRMLDNIRPVLVAYLKSKNVPIRREFAECTKMEHGMNGSGSFCQCCGRNPELTMHYGEKEN